jgi:hypothetical protein
MNSAGYLSVGATAFLTGYIAEHYGLRPAPFYLDIAFATLGPGFSALLVRDTGRHVALEVSHHAETAEVVSFGQMDAALLAAGRTAARFWGATCSSG